MRPEKKKIQTTVWFETALYRRFVAHASERGLYRNQLIERLVEAYLKAESKTPQRG